MDIYPVAFTIENALHKYNYANQEIDTVLLFNLHYVIRIFQIFPIVSFFWSWIRPDFRPHIALVVSCLIIFQYSVAFQFLFTLHDYDICEQNIYISIIWLLLRLVFYTWIQHMPSFLILQILGLQKCVAMSNVLSM